MWANYLRVRGEYVFAGDLIEGYTELPPRARRILPHQARHVLQAGTTSACAENTFMAKTRLPYPRNYLRVRGEYTSRKPTNLPSEELPPRARRIPQQICVRPRPPGTTSACAENTDDESYLVLDIGNYLRVRGEYETLALDEEKTLELPPRARRIHAAVGRRTRDSGTTSACAENTTHG